MAMLDGKIVEDSEIDPGKHKYIGSFRSPQPPDTGGAAVMVCPCGQHLWFVEAVFDHWQKGHFDIPQYVTI